MFSNGYAGKNNGKSDRGSWLTNKERFWSKVNKTDNCWEWKFGVDLDGYGQFYMNKSNNRAHRIAWIFENGQIANNLCVLHRCDNPGCVNPSHLFLGTIKDNVVDMDFKHRRNPIKNEKVWKATLSCDDVVEIRKLRSGGAKLKDLAKKYSVSFQAISAIHRRINWKNIP